MDSWQDIAALLLVSLAAASLLRRSWRVFFKQTRGCGSCSSCPGAAEPVKLQLLDTRLIAGPGRER